MPIGTLNPEDGNIIGGPTNGFADPALDVLANYGGSTRTHRPLLGSPVVDKGNPDFVTTDDPDFNDPFDGPLTELPNDQRGAGYNRLVAILEMEVFVIDIGAVEVQDFET